MQEDQQMTGYGIYQRREGDLMRINARQPNLRLLLSDLYALAPYNTRLVGAVITSR